MKLKELHEQEDSEVEDTFANMFPQYNPDTPVIELYINDRQIKHLKGCPKLIRGNFNCGDNHLSTLKDGPEKVEGYFAVNSNKLKSLEYSPVEVGEDFECSHNNLTSLEGASEKVGGSFFCTNNYLTSLQGAPKKLGGVFSFSNNNVTSLEGCPEEVVGGMFGYNNKLTSLKDIHLQIKKIKRTKDINNGSSVLDFTKNPIKSHVLGVMLIPDLDMIMIDNKMVQAIINRHLKNKSDVFECQNELMDNDLDEYAQL